MSVYPSSNPLPSPHSQVKVTERWGKLVKVEQCQSSVTHGLFIKPLAYFFGHQLFYFIIYCLLRVLAKLSWQNCRQRSGVSQYSAFSSLNSDFKSGVECHRWSELAGACLGALGSKPSSVGGWTVKLRV